MKSDAMREELGAAYRGRRVLLTGHTGFKGAWLALWLADLGADVYGYALAPPPGPGLFRLAKVEEAVHHLVGDVRDGHAVAGRVEDVRPDYVFHLAAQSLVRESYASPVATIETNVLGTVLLLEGIRRAERPCAVVVVTSDKAYENQERVEPYREEDPLGGHDPYSASKGAAEILVAAYGRSFFPARRMDVHGVAIATARAGNVLGGGDWGRDRLVPDAISSLAEGIPVHVRNPGSVRPWQHVLEPLAGYLRLGARLAGPGREQFVGPWNFGPDSGDEVPVRRVVDGIVTAWGKGAWVDRSEAGALHEAAILRLRTEKARDRLGWAPRWSLARAIERTVAWYRAYHSGAGPDDLRELTLRQIREYEGGA